MLVFSLFSKLFLNELKSEWNPFVIPTRKRVAKTLMKRDLKL